MQVASADADSCPPLLECTGVSGFVAFIDVPTTLYGVADWNSSLFAQQASAAVTPATAGTTASLRRNLQSATATASSNNAAQAAGGATLPPRRALAGPHDRPVLLYRAAGRKLAQQPGRTALTTQVGFSNTAYTIAAVHADGSPLVASNEVALLNLTARKTAAWSNRTVSFPTRPTVIPTLSYYLDSATLGTNSYSALKLLDTSPLVWNVSVLTDPQWGLQPPAVGAASLQPNAAASMQGQQSLLGVGHTAEEVQTQVQPGTAAEGSLGGSCYLATIYLQSQAAASATQLQLKLQSFNGNASCSASQVRGGGVPQTPRRRVGAGQSKSEASQPTAATDSAAGPAGFTRVETMHREQRIHQATLLTKKCLLVMPQAAADAAAPLYARLLLTSQAAATLAANTSSITPSSAVVAAARSASSWAAVTWTLAPLSGQTLKYYLSLPGKQQMPKIAATVFREWI